MADVGSGVTRMHEPKSLRNLLGRPAPMNEMAVHEGMGRACIASGERHTPTAPIEGNRNRHPDAHAPAHDRSCSLRGPEARRSPADHCRANPLPKSRHGPRCWGVCFVCKTQRQMPERQAVLHLQPGLSSHALWQTLILDGYQPRPVGSRFLKTRGFAGIRAAFSAAFPRQCPCR